MENHRHICVDEGLARNDSRAAEVPNVLRACPSLHQDARGLHRHPAGKRSSQPMNPVVLNGRGPPSFLLSPRSLLLQYTVLTRPSVRCSKKAECAACAHGPLASLGRWYSLRPDCGSA